MKLGFIGTGRMGAPMAQNLIRAGHELIVYDISRPAAEPVLAAGARWAESPAAVASQVPVVFASLPTPAVMEDVSLGEAGIRAGAKPGLVFFDLTTNSPTLVRRVGGLLAQAGVTLLDTPVSGGVGGARNATLAVMVGGDRATFDAHRSLLEAIGRNVFHLGPLGSGNVAKLVNNAVSFAQRAILAEGLVLGTKAGLGPEVLLAVIRSSSGDSAAIDRIRRTVETGDFSPNFTVDLACKDVGLAVQLAREQRVPYRFAGLVEQFVIDLQGEGRGAE
ncbi:MAG TPA: NAD(P)-dependent oxidoreductase, partial [Dehalococcoidia bacterium]|nr:NAD(P)-dependent oxidoreductase [Dehalococcoidia bacterium]